MTKIKSKKKIIIPVCIIAIIAVLCGSVAFFLPEKEIEQYNFTKGKQKGETFGEAYTPYVISGDNTLYVNEKTSAVAIADKTGNVVFNSHSTAAAKDKLACVLSVTFRDKAGNVYIKNSTDNSASSGKFTVSTEHKNDVTLTFEFVENKIVTETIPVKFYNENGGFKAEINTADVILQDGFCIEKLSILPGLFSENNPQKQSFYTVPDGCGAQVDLLTSVKKAYSKALPVYGSDVTFGEYAQGATLPCFSMTKNKSLLTVVVDEGDAISEIFVKHNKGVGGSLYNTFSVTSYGRVNGKLKKGSSYEGKISQTYYLTKDSYNNYNTSSALVRDALIDKGYLPSKMSSKFVDFPFFITAIGSENGKKNTVYTDFENSSEMLALLKSRGVRCMALRVAGAGEKGLNTGSYNAHKMSEALGGINEYNNLCKVATDKNSTVWYDVNLAVTPKEKGDNSTNLYGDLRAYLSKPGMKSSVDSYNYVYNNISSVYKLSTQLEGGAVCINDLSYLLYTDISGKVNRQTALDNLKDKTTALGVNGGLMLSKPAVYLMNQADAVFEMPEKSSLEEYDGVKNVPLLQLVLHGSVCYGSQPINLNADGTYAVLKAVEYGASPSFIFTHSNCAVLDYGVYSSQIAKYYSSAKRMLPLMDMKITSHEQVVSGVYKITYDYSKVVYVNYNPSVVEVNGILVSAKDFVVI